MFRRLFILFTDKELRNKLLLVIALAVVCRLVLFIPLPFVNIKDFIQLANNRSGDDISQFLNTVLGAGYGSVSVGMLGIGPYITASIVIQLLTVIVPKLAKMQEEGGTAAQMKMNQYTRLLALILSFVNGFVILLNVVSGNLTKGTNPFSAVPALSPFTYNPLSIAYLVFLASCLAAGTMFLMWLSEIISETKIANGASLLVLISSLSALPIYFGSMLEGVGSQFQSVKDTLFGLDFKNNAINNVWNFFLDVFQRSEKFVGFREFLLMILVTVFSLFAVIFVNEAIKHITVLYARRGHTEGASRMTSSVKSSLPIRITGAGLMGIIIAVAFIATPVILNNLTAFSNIEGLKTTTTDLRCFMSQDSLFQQSSRFNKTDELAAKCYGRPVEDLKAPADVATQGQFSKYQNETYSNKATAPKKNYLNTYVSQKPEELIAASNINDTDGQELFAFNISTFKDSKFNNQFDTGLKFFGTPIKTPEFKLNPGFLPEFGLRFNGILAYYLLFFLLVIFFNYFFTLVVQNSTERIGKDLQKMGAYVPGVNPGKATESWLESKIARVILPGALFTAFVAISPYLIPAMLGASQSIFNVIQGTVLFIIVSTALEIVRNLDAETSIVDYERYSKF